MALLIAILLGAAALAFVLSPILFQRASHQEGSSHQKHVDLSLHPPIYREWWPHLKPHPTPNTTPTKVAPLEESRVVESERQDLTVSRRAAPLEGAQNAEDPTQLSDSEHQARTALQEVELDYQLGNITETDYRSLHERYMRRALVALKSRYDREQEIDDEIEQALRELKERTTHAAE